MRRRIVLALVVLGAVALPVGAASAHECDAHGPASSVVYSLPGHLGNDEACLVYDTTGL